jgi:ribosomal protein S27E
MDQEILDRLRELIESSRRCKCGGNCELLKSLAEKILDIQFHEVGFKLECPHCLKEPLFFHHTNTYYQCRKCSRWYRANQDGALIELNLKEPELC